MEFRNKFVVMMLAFYLASGSFLTSCTKSRGALEESWQAELSQDYCPVLFNELAPAIPEGVEPIIERENPYPQVPDYRMYPDVSLTGANGKRLGLIARCLHRNCVKGIKPRDAERLARIRSCEPFKLNYMAHKVVEVLEQCTADAATRVDVIEKFRSLYESKGEGDFSVCPELLEGKPELAQSLDLPLRECDLKSPDCPEGLRCAVSGDGLRCIELPETVLGEIDIISDETDAPDAPTSRIIRYDQKAIGASCDTSRECGGEASCLSFFAGTRRCTPHCESATDCAAGQVCAQHKDLTGVCVAQCETKGLAASPKGELCVPTADGMVEVALDGAAFLEAYAVWQEKNPGSSSEKVFTAGAFESMFNAFELSSTCGNGKLEFGEACDNGSDNGLVAHGGWCTKECSLSECGNAKIEAGETCECLPGFTHGAKGDSRIQCPSRWAISDGSEKAIGWLCTSRCQVYHPRESLKNYKRYNEHFLPEFLCLEPYDKEGNPKPHCTPTKARLPDGLEQQPADGNKASP